KANLIFNIVFFVSVTSVLVQGTTLSIVAKWLHVALPNKAKRKTPVDIFLSDSAKSVLEEIYLENDNPSIGKKVVDLHFPKNAIIAMIKRGDKYITPNGTTVLEEQDALMVLAENRDGMEQVYATLNVYDREEEV